MEIEKIKTEKKFREIIESNGYLLIDFLIRGEKQSKVIEVYIDNEQGITVDNCAEITRLLNDAMVELGYGDESYRLDVSSPGSEKDMKYLIQYKKHINRWFNILYTEGETEKEEEIKLKNVEDEKLVFIKDQKEIILNFNDIKQAKVIFRIWYRRITTNEFGDCRIVFSNGERERLR